MYKHLCPCSEHEQRVVLGFARETILEWFEGFNYSSVPSELFSNGWEERIQLYAAGLDLISLINDTKCHQKMYKEIK